MMTVVFESYKYQEKFSICIERMGVIIREHFVYDYLSEKEQAELEDIIFIKRRREFILGKYVCKKAISELSVHKDFTKISIEHGVFNQPIVKSKTGENIQVSLSHCNKYIVAIAFNERFPCAIDVETIDAGNDNVIYSRLTQEELSYSTKLEEEKSIICTILWTAKEAISKIMRTGLTTKLDLYETGRIQKENEFFFGTFKNFYQYEFIARKYNGCICTIVLPKNPDIISIHKEVS